MLQSGEGWINPSNEEELSGLGECYVIYVLDVTSGLIVAYWSRN